MDYRVELNQDKDGVLVAEAPAVPGFVTSGSTWNQARWNIHEAAHGYAESLKAHAEPVSNLPYFDFR